MCPALVVVRTKNAVCVDIGEAAKDLRYLWQGV